MNLKDLYKYTFCEEPSRDFCSGLNPRLYPFFLKRIYRYRTGERLNLDNPKTFSEKIQWLKLNDSTKVKSDLTDKVKVREYVKEKIGPDYLKNVYDVWDNFEDIDFQKLPDIFVLKTNHSCGTNTFIKKEDLTANNIKALALKYKDWIESNFSFAAGFEMHYTNIERKIFAEEFIPNIQEYQVMCFNGSPKYICVYYATSNGLHTSWYDTDIKLQPFNLKSNTELKTAQINENVAKHILNLSEKLATNFPLVRCDFNLSNNRILFEEMTFTPTSGFKLFTPDKYERKLGDLLTLKQ